MNPNKYAYELQKNLGLDKAQKLAKRSADASSKSSVTSLPVGDVFYKKDRRGSVSVDNNHYLRLNGFWTHIYSILKKYK